MEKKTVLLVFICMLMINSVFVKGTNINIHNSLANSSTEEDEIRSTFSTDWWPMFHHDLLHTGYSTSKTSDTLYLRWSYKTGDNIFSSPAVYDNKVYIGSNDDKIYCLDAENGNLVWSYQAGGNVRSSPAVYDGKVYIGSMGGKICCLDAENGNLVWSYQADGYGIYSSPAVDTDNKRVYIGVESSICCLTLNNGGFIWSYQAEGSILSSPAVYDGKVYIGSNDYKIYCLSEKNGAVIWSYQTGDNVRSSPAVYDGKVYIGSNDGKIYCLDAENGNLVWSSSVGEAVLSSPAIYNGKMYIGSVDYKVYCFDAENGNLVWSYQTDRRIEYSSPAIADEKVYIGSMDGKIYCLNAETGDLLWSYQTDGGIKSSPAIADEKVYIGSVDGKIYCFSEPEETNNPPEKPNKPLGPTNGNVDTLYNYSSSATDPDGDQIYYLFDWGDGTNTGWLGPYNSNQKINVSHSWSEKGTYQIRVKAKDYHCVESEWSDSLTVTMPKNKISSIFNINHLWLLINNLIKRGLYILGIIN